MREELCNSDPIIEKENEIRERGRGRESFTKSILAFSGLSQILGPFLFPLVKISRSGFDKTVSPPLKSETLKPQTPFILFQISINTGTFSLILFISTPNFLFLFIPRLRRFNSASSRG